MLESIVIKYYGLTVEVQLQKGNKVLLTTKTLLLTIYIIVKF
jgi:hypothetical protein